MADPDSDFVEEDQKELAFNETNTNKEIQNLCPLQWSDRHANWKKEILAIGSNVIVLAFRPGEQRDVSLLQNSLADNKEDDKDLPNPEVDSHLEAEREVAMYKLYPQDAMLSTNAREWWTTKHLCPT